MSSRFTIAAANAKSSKEQTGQGLRQDRSFLRSNYAAVQKLRTIYPVKTAHHLHLLTGIPLRTCEYCLSKERLSPEAIWALLQSEHGIHFLVAGMGDARPKWFGWLLRLGVAGSVMRRRAADKRLLEQTLDAEHDLAKTIATTAMLQDEEFHRPFLDALGSMGGVQGGGVVAAKEKR
jgi:hypothetical protein